MAFISIVETPFPSIPNVGSPNSSRRRLPNLPIQVLTAVVVKCPNCQIKFRSEDAQEYCSKECCVSAQWFTKKKSSQSNVVPQETDNLPTFWRVRSRAPSPTNLSPAAATSSSTQEKIIQSPAAIINKTEARKDPTVLVQELAEIPRPEATAHPSSNEQPFEVVVDGTDDGCIVIQARPPGGPRPSRRSIGSSNESKSGRHVIKTTISADDGLQTLNTGIWRDCNSLKGGVPRKPTQSIRATHRIETTYKGTANEVTHRGSNDFNKDDVSVMDKMNSIKSATNTRSTLSAIAAAASDYFLLSYASAKLPKNGRFVKN